MELENLTITENQALALKSTVSPELDLFYNIGAKRNKDILPLFIKSYSNSPEISIRIALWGRDAREGCGERQIFKDILKYLEINEIEIFKRVVIKVPELGRWDDLLICQTEEGFNLIAQLIKDDINKNSKRSLAAKWMPRKGEIANKLRKKWKMNPKEYRKFLVENTNVVENQMCLNKWDEINYEEVPSLAMTRYTKAFNKHSKETFSQYKVNLSKGEVKINTNAIYPYDIINNLLNGDSELAELQWKNLGNVFSMDKVIPLVDVSGSMSTKIGKTLTAMNVAISLGLYMTERQNDEFKDLILTFETKPKFINLRNIKTLKERYNMILESPWGGSTNIESAFDLILNKAIEVNATKEEIPNMLIIFSDMEFNSAISNNSNTMYEICKKRYNSKGYDLPIIIFWNLVSRNDHVPVRFDTNGTILLSGFSPKIIKYILNNLNDITPLKIMNDIIMNERYNF